jgi:1-acyl-sn-glycerol-3-phosphate acyltransferase
MKRTPIYRFLELVMRTILLGWWDYRTEGVENVPAEGGLIVAATHQSHLDPVAVQAFLPRRLGYVARTTLFRNPAFAWMIRELGAVELDREAASAEGIKEIVEILSGGQALVFFPEGTRTSDGEIGPLKPGIALLAKKSGVPVVPVAIEGTYRCWPRQKKMFRPGKVRVVYGEPVVYGRTWKRGAIMDDLDRRLHELQARARELA